MFTPLDWTVRLEQSRLSLTRFGQERFAQLAYPVRKTRARDQQSAAKPAAKAQPVAACCCEPVMA